VLSAPNWRSAAGDVFIADAMVADARATNSIVGRDLRVRACGFGFGSFFEVRESGAQKGTMQYKD
jgi:hypothetical protein